MRFLFYKKYFLMALFSLNIHCWETDQFTLPTEKLADIGPYLESFIQSSIRSALTEFNKQTLLRRHKTSQQKRREFSRILWQEIGPKIAKQDHRDGVFGKDLSLFHNPKGKIKGKNVLFNPGKKNNIYTYAGFHRILSASYFIHSSTINTYGILYGLDKLGHIFNQGYQYYTLYRGEKESGQDEQASQAIAVNFGIRSEKSYFGKLVSGVYSNGDLAANFIGFLFYKNFFEDIIFHNKNYPAILKENDDQSFSLASPQSLEHIFKRLVSIHLNEAPGPSQYEFLQRPFIREAIESRCPSWEKAYPHLTRKYYNDLLKQVQNLHGFSYGHRENQEITLRAICFPLDSPHSE